MEVIQAFVNIYPTQYKHKTLGLYITQCLDKIFHSDIFKSVTVVNPNASVDLFCTEQGKSIFVFNAGLDLNIRSNGIKWLLSML